MSSSHGLSDEVSQGEALIRPGTDSRNDRLLQIKELTIVNLLLPLADQSVDAAT